MNRKRLLAETEDIERLCQPRELSTAEVFSPNAFYGNDLVLKRYAGLPDDKPLKVVVPHGIVFNLQFVWEQEARAPLPAVLAYGDDRERAYARATRKLRIRAATPFAYLGALMGEAPGVRRSGTLFFPAHSSHRITAEADFEGIAERLLQLEDKYQPVSVCIYWRDYELGRHRPFLARGFRVVTAGHIFDPMFLPRLYCLCQAHRFASSNHVGSSLPYAVLAGCAFFLLAGFGVNFAGTRGALTEDFSGVGPAMRALEEAFAMPVDKTTPYQRDLVDRLTGLQPWLSPEALRELLLMADGLDRYGIARDPRDGRVQVALPQAYSRAAWRLLYAARRLAA